MHKPPFPDASPRAVSKPGIIDLHRQSLRSHFFPSLLSTQLSLLLLCLPILAFRDTKQAATTICLRVTTKYLKSPFNHHKGLFKAAQEKAMKMVMLMLLSMSMCKLTLAAQSQQTLQLPSHCDFFTGLDFY